MKNRRESYYRFGVIAVVLAIVLFTAMGSSVWACSDKGSQQDVAKQKQSDMGDAKHKLRPHNAAVHFLGMATRLDLTHEQTARLVKLRDDYIVKNATGEAQLKAANHDLAGLLHADDVDMKAVNARLDKAGKLESQLWQAFAQQLHDIKAMLTPEQKMALNGKQRMGQAGMAGKYCNLPNAKGGCDQCDCAKGGSCGCGCAKDGACKCGCAMGACSQRAGAEAVVKTDKDSHKH